jgi:hypothetical protein
MSGITIGATWDKAAFYSRGYMMGQEFRGKGVNIGLFPVCGPIGKNPEGGRYALLQLDLMTETGKDFHQIPI